MSILFAGGEDGDLWRIGACSVDTATTAARRTNNSRCSLKVNSSSEKDGWQATFSAASTLWATARGYFASVSNVANTAGGHTIFFADANGVRRLGLTFSTTFGANYNFPWKLIKRNAAGTETTLVTSGTNLSVGTLTKFEVYVNYAASGSFKLYVDGALIIDYSGDVTTDGATQLGQLILGTDHGYINNCSAYWSEIIVADEDTRSMSLARLTPLAAGNTQEWTGSVSDINEQTLDDATLISSATANQVAQFTVTPASVITGSIGIRAVAVNARAMKGASGPQNAQMSVRTGGADYFSATKALQALSVVSNVWDTNPGGGAWTAAQLTAAGFNVGIKSIA